MGRGKLTKEEVIQLKKNPYVEDVDQNRITYSEEFKLLFIKEYFRGQKPTAIFRAAGFDIKALGSKRIERCSARWREANASGSLGEKYSNNDFYEKHENQIRELQRIISEKNEEIEKLTREVMRFQEMTENTHIMG